MATEDMGLDGLTGNGSSNGESVGGIAPGVEAVTSPAPQSPGDADLTVVAEAQVQRVVLYERWTSIKESLLVPEKDHGKYANTPGWWCWYEQETRHGLHARKFTAEGVPA